MTSLLDFYQQHGISPVRQDLRDLPAHLARRAGLYRALGLPPMAVTGKHVLEIGPGPGHNALYTAILQPARYVLLEPNRAGAEPLRRRSELLACEIYQQRLEDFPRADPFDLVLCEGLLGLSGTDSLVLLAALTPHVKPGGVLVITCIDPISDHAEVLRRAYAQSRINRAAPLEQQVAELRPIFTSHLAYLSGMTRSVDDWILDNLLNPASIGPTFSIPEAITALDAEFDLLGCSPRFLTDWRWYKNITPGNQWAMDAYWSQAHNLLDYRRVETYPVPPEKNRDLYAQCLEFREALRRFEDGTGPAPIPPAHHRVMADPGWFGRGQQYLSFVRRESVLS